MKWFMLVAIVFTACSETVTPKPAPAGIRLPIHFPPLFLFGFATVAYQSEGTIKADGGRVHSNWSEWEDMGKVKGEQRNPGGNGFFSRYTEDLDRSASLGATAFSYAIDWARLEPEPGQFDDVELQRVVDLITAMRNRNLRPLIVLFHWVTPYWVQSPKSGVDLLARDNRHSSMRSSP